MSEPRISIRRAEDEDIDGILRILDGCPKIAWSESQVREEFQGKGKFPMVGFRDGVMVGFCFIRTVDDTAELLLIATKAQVRRKGYASEIAHEMQQELTTLGIKEVFLEVRKSNLAAVHLYQALGYTQFAVRPKYYRSPIEDAILFKLTLTDCQPNYSGLE